MHYLTTHDLVWVNAIVTGETLSYDYEAVEQGMAAQYRYGNSTDAPGQGAFFLQTMLRKRPFEYGNRRTAFLAELAFLRANGLDLRANDRDAAAIVRQVESGEMASEAAIQALTAPAADGLREGTTLRSLLTRLAAAHGEALELLKEGDE